MLKVFVGRAPVAAARSTFGLFGAAGSRGIAGVAPVLAAAQRQERFQAKPLNAFGQAIQQRNAGVSILGCGLATIALGGVATGMGNLFAALVVGIARNPSMKDELFTNTIIGVAFVELMAIITVVIAGALMFSE